MDPIDYAQARDAELTAEALAKRERARVAALLQPGRSECERCGHAIGAARRAAVPHATECIDCARRAERPPMARRRR